MAQATIRRLLTAAAVRERAHEMLDLAVDGKVEGWRVNLSKLADAAALAASVTRAAYPTLDIPYHARARHFVAGAPRLPEGDPASQARAAFDLTIVSVLLDAGAGAQWRYRDAVSGRQFSRSEGLAVASQRMFESGAFSSRADDPLRADAATLAKLSPAMLERGFQVDAENQMVGLDGRAALLRRLGERSQARADLFARGDTPRPGGLADVLRAEARSGRLPATPILELVLEALGPIWQNRIVCDGVSLGDCWRHPAIRRPDDTDQMVPLHKLSQWLSYSLIEPLEASGIEVTDIDGLTGLAEYRNGGLFIDTGVLVLTDPADAAKPHEVGDPLIVSWRALTVALLDRMAPIVRELLGVDAARFPLARMLEGGSWAAGRIIARERRPDGTPPLTIISDGTVF